LGTAFCIALQPLLEIYDGSQKEVLRRLLAAMLSFDQALRERGADASPQGKYAEPRASSSGCVYFRTTPKS
jgi:hypothetical protein